MLSRSLVLCIRCIKKKGIGLVLTFLGLKNEIVFSETGAYDYNVNRKQSNYVPWVSSVAARKRLFHLYRIKT